MYVAGVPNFNTLGPASAVRNISKAFCINEAIYETAAHFGRRTRPANAIAPAPQQGDSAAQAYAGNMPLPREGKFLMQHSSVSRSLRMGLLAPRAGQEIDRAEFRCRIILDGDDREERLLSVIPNVGSRMALGANGREYYVQHVRQIANGRRDIDPDAIVYTSRVRIINTTAREHAMA